MDSEFDPETDRAARNWVTALNLYRTSLDLYRRALSVGSGHPDTPIPPLPPVGATYPGAESGGATCLTARECEVAQLVARGFTNQQIADELIVTRGTVANHVAHILSELGLSNRTQVAAYFIGGLMTGQTEGRDLDTWTDPPPHGGG